jgi:hypothetical protein
MGTAKVNRIRFKEISMALINCKVCKNHGFKPRCPFCGRSCRPTSEERKAHQLQLIKDNAEREKARLNQQAHKQFKNIQAKGSGCESFDQQLKDTLGDWLEQ